jgi:hypothetical protein
MADEQTLAPVEASDEAVDNTAPIEAESEATENTEGQEQAPPASEPEEQVSPSKARRERRKAEAKRLKESEAQAKKDLAETQARLDRVQQVAQESQPPKQEDYPNYDDFLAAKTAHSSMAALDARQKRELELEAERQTQVIQGISQQEIQEMARNWADQSEDARQKYTDFDKVIKAVPGSVFNERMARIITASDIGTDVAYHLGTNKEEAARIAQMSDLDAARHIGRLEARLSMPQVKTQTTAPDPVTPVKGKATATKDPDKMTMDEYRAWRSGG